MTGASMNSRNQIVVFKLEGDLPVPQLLDLKAKISQAVERKQSVVLDLEKVRILNSNAVGLLVNSSQKLKAAGGRLYLLAPSPDVYEMMTLVGLEEQVHIYRDRKQFADEVTEKKEK